MTVADLTTLTTADAPYWRWLAEGELRLPRCANCHRWMWPPEFRCAVCGAKELDWVQVERAGIVYSWTTTWYPFVPERSNELPYTVVLGELAQAGNARLLGVLSGPADGIAIGQALVATIDPPTSESRGFPALRWHLAGDGNDKGNGS
jgi:uncharacterized OB-fold protein